jgi:hypothetical protein
MTFTIPGVNIIYSISYLIRSNKSRKEQFINSGKKEEVFLVFADDSYLASS